MFSCLLPLVSCFLPLVGKVFADTQGISDVPYKVKRIIDGSSMDYNPVFSPDGKQIVFVSKIDNTEKIKKGEFWHKTPYSLNLWMIDADGNNRRQLTSGEFYDFAPRFTPDDKKIFFVSNRSGRWDIWSINSDGSDIKSIAVVDKDAWEEKAHHPFPTPDGKGLAFILYRNEPVSIWLADMEGKSRIRATSGGYGDFFPVVSPDGRQILFESLRQGNGDIWSIDIAEKRYNRLTFGDYPEFYPTLTPDGAKITYVTNKEGIIDVWVMDRDGKNKRRLIKHLSKGVWGSKFDYNDLMDAGYYNISWHPDGTRLALTTLDPDKKESYLTLIDFGRDISKVAEELPVEEESLPDYTLIGEKDITGDGNWDDFGPHFSPDGKTIVFASNRKGNWDIWSIGSEGSGLKQITENPVNELAPVFSPDGKEIAYLKRQEVQPLTQNFILSQGQGGKKQEASNRTSNYDIWIMKSDGSGTRQVTKDINVISYPAWNPEGKEIAFVAKGDKGPEIQLIPVNNPLSPFIKRESGDEGVVTVSRVISIWDTEKPNPAKFPFAKEAVSEEEFTPPQIKKKRKPIQNGEARVDELTPFTRNKLEVVPYPLEEFLHRVDYNITGDRLIFESNLTGGINIWVVNRDGTGLTGITKGDSPHINPVFSPDNKRITYARRGGKKLEIGFYKKEGYDIWIANMDTGEEILINDEEQMDWNPVFSPDSKRIAYVTNRSGDFKHFNIWLLYLK